MDVQQQPFSESSPLQPQSRFRLRPWMVVIPVLAIVTVTIAGTVILKRRGAKPPVVVAGTAPVLTVATEPVELRPLVRTLAVTGSVAPWDLLSVFPAANGLRIMRVAVEEGDRVSDGQILAQLDDGVLQAQHAAARARLANAEAQLSKMRRPNRSQDIASFEAALRQAEANVRSAEDMNQRTKALLAESAVSPAEATGRETALAAAKAGADQARQRLSLAREGSRNEDLSMAEAGVAAERAGLRQLEVQLAQTRVTAPAGGLVLNRSAHLGDMAANGQRLFQIVRDERYELQAQVPEADLAGITSGQAALITSDADPTMRIAGKVRLVSPGFDPSSRQGVVRIDLSGDRRLRSGMFVRGLVDLGDVQMLAVPSAAVLNKEGASLVFVLEGDIVHARRVDTTVRSGNLLGIRTGLRQGEQVVVAGAGYLKDGDRVRVAPALGMASDVAAMATGSEAAAAASDTVSATH
ncbi:MAG: efflux RND transporter periplasmic adaptor subunit [Candidatus Sericytochromatia bacterium]|nr:efflux RND transporter periplasmic adaptor subunit [Candidatus Sericytochromatia bacterium]